MNNMFVKIINNEIVYSSIFMFLECENSWVSYPNVNQLISDGWKELEIIITDDINKPEYEELNDKIINYIKN